MINLFRNYQLRRNKAHALAFVREVSGADLAELPPGKRSSRTSCVLAKAFEVAFNAEPGQVSVSGLAMYYKVDGLYRKTRVLPPNIVRFVKDFDNGFYPELTTSERPLILQLMAALEKDSKIFEFLDLPKKEDPTGMDIKEIPDTETTHTPLESPVPGKEILPPPPEVPKVPERVPEPDREPVKV